ncbi:MAG: hypothetical protein P1P84_01375 [Deferrisomatales bacterium]|nr:hypothetical protein [Deferrisomatales bacterium]
MATRRELALHLDLSERRVTALAGDKILPNGPGYDLDECRVGYIRHLRSQASGTGGTDLTAQRARLAAAQAEKVERENRVRSGELMRRDDAIAEQGEGIRRARALLLGLPHKCAPLLAATRTPQEAAEILGEEIHRALYELAFGFDPNDPDETEENLP